jgi:hypothetical protein
MDLSVSETRRIPMGYFSLGFAIACIGGDFAVVLLSVHTADAHVPRGCFNGLVLRVAWYPITLPRGLEPSASPRPDGSPALVEAALGRRKDRRLD